MMNNEILFANEEVKDFIVKFVCLSPEQQVLLLATLDQVYNTSILAKEILNLSGKILQRQ